MYVKIKIRGIPDQVTKNSCRNWTHSVEVSSTQEQIKQTNLEWTSKCNNLCFPGSCKVYKVNMIEYICEFLYDRSDENPKLLEKGTF